MPIVSKVEARSRRGRIVFAIILVLLTLGGITMLYPFAIMVSGSLRSEMDESDLDLVPGYMVDRDVLYRKFLEVKYNQDPAALNRGHGRINYSFKDAALVPHRRLEELALTWVDDARAMRLRAASLGAASGSASLASYGAQLATTADIQQRRARTLLATQRPLRDTAEAIEHAAAELVRHAEGLAAAADGDAAAEAARRLADALAAAAEPLRTEAERQRQALPRRAADLRAFFEQADPPQHWQVLGGIYGVRTVPENLRKLRDRLEQRFEGDIHEFGRTVGSPVEAWNRITVPAPEWFDRRYEYAANAIYETYFDLVRQAPPANRQLISLSGRFLETMVFPIYSQVDTTAYNAAHPEATLDSYEAFVLPAAAPGADQPTFRKEWTEFVLLELNPAFVVLEGVDAATFQSELETKYGTIDQLNRVWHADYAAFDAVELPAGEWLSGARRGDYREFLEKQDPGNFSLVGAEYAWRHWLARRYESIEALNDAHAASWQSFDEVRMPQDELEYDHVTAHAGALRWRYATHNFVNVINELFLRGRAFLNTVIFCALAIVTALLVNPMAAYAMSRFELPGTYRILLLLMATMSFPPMVTLIPTFLILRKLELMNTFAALVLPMAANGYLIFLLKGFFDSLPRDLYEAATLDGALEIRMFFQITMALSKPILAVVALQAFNGAYMMFLYALLVCPSRDMWLLSVWLYQFQQDYSTSSVFASVLVACIPTLLVFIFCQNIIMRGIVVPVEK